MDFEIQPAGEEAILVSVSYEKTRECVAAVRALVDHIRTNRHPSIRSLRPALDALLIEYTPDPSFDEWLGRFKRMEISTAPNKTMDQEVVVIPICYDLGYDLPDLCEQTGLTASEIIETHAAVEYEVWMIGFMPGFPYMGELPAKLQVQRKKNPVMAIPAGSVAIAEEYVGIYPFESPGGWHVIGRTPLKMIDYNRSVPWKLDYGMKVRFRSISMDEFESNPT